MSSAESAQHRARRRLFFDAYFLTAGTLLNAAAGFFTNTLNPRFFDDEVVGTAAQMVAAMLLLAGIAQLDLTNVLHRFLPASGASAKRLILGVYATVFSLSVVLAAAYAAIDPIGTFDGNRWAILWFAAAVGLWSLFNLQDQVLVGLGAAWLVPFENTVHGFARIALLALFIGGPASAILASWILPVVVLLVVVSAVIAFRILPAHRVRVGDDETTWDLRMVSRFAVGGYVGGIAGLVLQQLLPLLVAHHLGTVATAHFAMVWLMASTVDLVAYNFGASLVIQGASNPSHVPHLMRSALRRQLMMIVPGLVVLALFSHPILTLAFTAPYANDTSTLLTLLAIGLIPRVFWVMYLPALRLKGDVKTIVISQSCTNLSVLSATVAGLYLGGFNGVGVGYCVAQLILASVIGPKLWKLLHADRLAAGARNGEK